MQFSGDLEERISKANKPYTVLLLNITDTYQKVVFLTDAELELIQLLNSADYD